MAFPLETIVAWAKRKWFVYPGSQIYGGLANAWDYGPYGSQLKKNIADAWWNFFVNQRNDMIGMDTAILAHPRTWDASGHTENFGDFLIDDKKTGQRFRPDKLIEDHIEKQKKKSSEAAVLADIQENIWVSNLIPEARWAEGMKKYFDHYGLKNPDTWADAERTEIRKFNLMLYTYLGPIHNEENKVWMRPETCQSMFTNFKNICDTTRMRVPFGMAQIGKAFRNEITPGQFLYRTREFEQMEIEYFVPANKEESQKYFDKWKEDCMIFWKEIIQLKPDNVKFREHEQDELSHYSLGTFDVEYAYPWGWGELQGLANRGSWDLTRHQEFSQQDMQYKDPKTGERYIPWVIEPSFGLSRTVMAVMMDCYDEEVLSEETDENGNTKKDTRIVARFPFAIAPVKFAILPLIEKNDEMVTMGEEIFKTLSKRVKCEFDTSGNVGKRYRRQDEIGTPYCITIDYDSINPESENYKTVTIRHRDSMAQERVAIYNLTDYIK